MLEGGVNNIINKNVSLKVKFKLPLEEIQRAHPKAHLVVRIAAAAPRAQATQNFSVLVNE